MCSRHSCWHAQLLGTSRKDPRGTRNLRASGETASTWKSTENAFFTRTPFKVLKKYPKHFSIHRYTGCTAKTNCTAKLVKLLYLSIPARSDCERARALSGLLGTQASEEHLAEDLVVFHPAQDRHFQRQPDPIQTLLDLSWVRNTAKKSTPYRCI